MREDMILKLLSMLQWVLGDDTKIRPFFLFPYSPQFFFASQSLAYLQPLHITSSTPLFFLVTNSNLLPLPLPLFFNHLFSFDKGFFLILSSTR